MGQPEVDIDYFLEDEYFVQWVLQPDENSNLYWKNWISNHPQQAETMTMARQVVLSLRYKTSYKLAEEEQRNLLDNLLTQQDAFERQKRVERYAPSKRYRTYKIAAIFLCIATLSFGIWAVVEESDHWSGATHTTEVKMIEKTSSRGQKLTVKLPDGTVIKLNAGSKLIYPQEFTGNERNVSLYGEAFFEVVKNPDKPFVISTEGLKTKVLGTSFNVRSYPEEAEIKVAVLTGKVEISATNGNSSVLLPAEMGIFEKDKTSISIDNYDFRKEIAWKDGVLYFEKDDFKTVIRKLEMWYGVKLEVEKGFEFKGLYSGEFRNNKPLEMVLEGISFTSGFNYQIEAGTVTITKKNKPL